MIKFNLYNNVNYTKHNVKVNKYENFPKHNIIYHDFRKVNEYNKKNKLDISDKNIKNNFIPKKIFQTWTTKNLPVELKNATNILRKLHPDFEYNFYDDDMCDIFIKNNFNEKVYRAYNKLIPIEYKRDFWKFAILYKYGGIYLDIKLVPHNDKCIFDKFLDNKYFYKDKNCIFKLSDKIANNLFLISYPKSKIFKKILDSMVNKILSGNEGENAYDIIGPIWLCKQSGYFPDFFEIDTSGYNILYNNKNYLTYYKDNTIDLSNTIKKDKKNYELYYDQGNVFNNLELEIKPMIDYENLNTENINMIEINFDTNFIINNITDNASLTYSKSSSINEIDLITFIKANYFNSLKYIILISDIAGNIKFTTEGFKNNNLIDYYFENNFFIENKYIINFINNKYYFIDINNLQFYSINSDV